MKPILSKVASASVRFVGSLCLIGASALIWVAKELLSQSPPPTEHADSGDIHESDSDASSTESHGYIGDHDTYPTKIRHYDS